MYMVGVTTTATVFLAYFMIAERYHTCTYTHIHTQKTGECHKPTFFSGRKTN